MNIHVNKSNSDQKQDKYTVPDTPTHSRVFLDFYYFLHCRIIVKTSPGFLHKFDIVTTNTVSLN